MNLTFNSRRENGGENGGDNGGEKRRRETAERNAGRERETAERKEKRRRDFCVAIERVSRE